ncbi:CDP-glycerol glycerophosphotransferase family protein [Microbulbifer sp. ANSA003]|uniref:CDP-glycerol glycerophosphotransferase family protein n=1 Tax=Microbulbifer sp. ANSA003 TaxID=3243360 RepID=UPI004040FE67
MTGIDKVAVEVCNEMVLRGHEVVYITVPGKFKTEYLELSKRIRLHLISNNYRKNNIEKLRSILLAEMPDVVIPMFSNSIVSIFLGALRGTGIPLILSEHSDPEYYIDRWWTLGRGREEKRHARLMSFYAADQVHLLNHKFADDLPDFLKDKLSVIPNPVPILIDDISTFNDREKIVVSIGRLEESGKNLSLLIHAFSLLKNRLNGWKLHIYGDGPDKEYYRSIISQESLHDHVKLKGFTEKPKEVIGGSRVFCIPSVFEGCPLTLIESKALGVPALGFHDCTGVQQMIHHGVDGLLIQERTPQAISIALEALFRDEGYLESLSKNALEDAKKYERGRVFDQWESMIERVVSQSKAYGSKLDSVPYYNLQQQLNFELDELTKNFSYQKRLSPESYLNEWRKAQRYIGDVERSFSWRITKPLRWMKLLLRSLLDFRVSLKKVMSRKVVLRNWLLRKIGGMLPSRGVVFIDVPGFQDMKTTFGSFFEKECFFENMPFPFFKDLKIARAKVIVSACGAVKSEINQKASRLELWHASGAVKSVDNHSYKRLSSKYVIASPSDDMSNQYAKYFNVSIEDVLSVGVPKTDKLICPSSLQSMRDDFFSKNKELYGKKVYLFAPTFRGQWPTDVWYSCKLDFSKIASRLQEDEVFLVKLHPSIFNYNGYHNIDFVAGKVIDARDCSIDQLLAVSDAVISDYSSIIFDAVLMNKKMVLYAEDIDLYDLDRGLSYDYRGLAPCPIMESPDELKLLNFLRWGVVDQYAYKLFRDYFVNRCDGNSTSRVLELINELAGKGHGKSKSFNSGSSIQYGESPG